MAKEQKLEDHATPVGEDELQRQLITLQIKHAEKKLSRGWLWHMGPTIGAIAASIAASYIIIIFGSEAAKEVVTYYQSGVETSRQQKQALAIEIEALQSELSSKRREIQIEEERKRNLSGKAAAIQDFIESEDEPARLGLSVSLKQVGGSHVVIAVETYPEGANVNAYSICQEDLVIPGNQLDIDRCELILDAKCADGITRRCNSRDLCADLIAPCEFGPVSPFGIDPMVVWVTAKAEGYTVNKLVHLSTRRQLPK